MHGGSNVLVEAFTSYMGTEYRSNLVEYPVFDLRLLKRCLQRSAASVFGNLGISSMTEFVIHRLNGVETRDCMAFRLALRKAIITNDSTIPQLVDVVGNTFGL